jgi:transposase
MEQRANIKFCIKTGKTATETFQLIKQAYGDNALSRTWVLEWYARFRDGRENLEDDERSGRPTAVRTPDMMETVRKLISTDHRMTLRMMGEELEIIRETIRRILMEDLVKRNICARFVPHCLTDEQNDLKLTAGLSRVYLICG